MSTPDPRVDRLERDVDRVQDQINTLHSGSMQLVTTAFTEMERRLGEKIDKQTRDLKIELNDLRDAMVPLSEHTSLMQRVDVLYARDLQGREEWDRMVPQVRTLWEERNQQAGTRHGWRLIAAGLGIVVTVLTALTLMRGLGYDPLR